MVAALKSKPNEDACVTVPVHLIRTDGGTQPRDHIDEDKCREYAEAIQDGAIFPPIVIYYDGTDYWLASGFHRLAAYRMLEADSIPADVRQGTRRDAILHSVGTNATHGLPRSQEDKRRVVRTLLNDPEWAQWSDREIARLCKVSHPFVGAVRADLTGNVTSERTYTTKHGNMTTMNTVDIGRRPVEPVPAPAIALEPSMLPPVPVYSHTGYLASVLVDLAGQLDLTSDEFLQGAENPQELKAAVAVILPWLDALHARLTD